MNQYWKLGACELFMNFADRQTDPVEISPPTDGRLIRGHRAGWYERTRGCTDHQSFPLRAFHSESELSVLACFHGVRTSSPGGLMVSASCGQVIKPFPRTSKLTRIL
ncbi:hypothetical protein BaRGS_00000869 [Batillaria attramentaria]|uniref:Uncharacterized protein n=1 Tax=Batillaria attramentaria TaxID=370345 RepID=A0ABD0M7H0_9CAEN